MTTITRSPFYFDRVDQRTRRVSTRLIQAVCDYIVAQIQPDKVILFGSHAAGKARSDSDLDLLVILPNSHPIAGLSNRDRVRRVMDLFPYRFFALDVIAVTDGEIDGLKRTNEGEWNLILELLQTGKIMYEKG